MEIKICDLALCQNAFCGFIAPEVSCWAPVNLRLGHLPAQMWQWRSGAHKKSLGQGPVVPGKPTSRAGQQASGHPCCQAALCAGAVGYLGLGEGQQSRIPELTGEADRSTDLGERGLGFSPDSALC